MHGPTYVLGARYTTGAVQLVDGANQLLAEHGQALGRLAHVSNIYQYVARDASTTAAHSGEALSAAETGV